MKASDFDYELPHERIAQRPIEPRDHARLMVVDMVRGRISHRHFFDLPEFLRPEDCLVLNDTRVLPARLIGRKEPTGGRVEFLLLRPLSHDRWQVLAKPGRRVRVGTQVLFGDELQAEVVEADSGGERTIRFVYAGSFEDVLKRLGRTPLPPYITEDLEDDERYQTVYSRDPGSIAAPTAGLHFTENLLDEVRSLGTTIVPLTLHVGIGTFRPVQVEDVADHKMHAEYYELADGSASAINACRTRGGRVVAVGTTVVRTLETLGTNGCVQGDSGWTDIFIYPGFEFRVVDGMITNFHLPKSTLLMLVAAMAGRDLVMQAYQEALDREYRFFSFGDAMLFI